MKIQNYGENPHKMETCTFIALAPGVEKSSALECTPGAGSQTGQGFFCCAIWMLISYPHAGVSVGCGDNIQTKSTKIITIYIHRFRSYT